MKKHLIQLTEKENDKLQEIKKYLRYNNVNQVFCYLLGFYAKEMENNLSIHKITKHPEKMRENEK